MSLAAYAIRTTLWRALLGKTFAGGLVFDSAVAPIEEMIEGKPTPIVTISTDEETIEVSGNNLAGGDRDLTIVIEMALATAVTDKAGVTIAHTDEGLEQALNYMVRQVMRVLQVDDGDWTDLYRDFVDNTTKIVSRRAAGDEKGLRAAARQLVITVNPLHEPPFGEAPAGAWARLLAAMRGDEILRDFADGFEREIIGTALPDWKRLQASMGYRRAGMAAVGLGPLLPGEAPAVVTKATVERPEAGTLVP